MFTLLTWILNYPMPAISGFEDLARFLPTCSLVIKFNIWAVRLQVFDTALIRTRYLMGRATLKGRFWVQLLSEPLLSSSAGWKMLDLRRACFCLQLFSHPLLLTNLPISVQREGGLIKWGIFTVDLSWQILPKRPYWLDLIWWGYFPLYYYSVISVFWWQPNIAISH